MSDNSLISKAITKIKQPIKNAIKATAKKIIEVRKDLIKKIG